MEYRKLYIESKGNESFDDVEFKIIEFQKFIKTLIECDDIETNSSSFNERSTILIHSFVDLDEVLSVISLSMRYGLKFENFENEEEFE